MIENGEVKTMAFKIGFLADNREENDVKYSGEERGVAISPKKFPTNI